MNAPVAPLAARLLRGMALFGLYAIPFTAGWTVAASPWSWA